MSTLYSKGMPCYYHDIILVPESCLLYDKQTNLLYRRQDSGTKKLWFQMNLVIFPTGRPTQKCQCCSFLRVCDNFRCPRPVSYIHYGQFWYIGDRLTDSGTKKLWSYFRYHLSWSNWTGRPTQRCQCCSFFQVCWNFWYPRPFSFMKNGQVS